MEKQAKQKLTEQLFSTNEKTVLEALKKIKKQGDQILLQAILELLYVNKSPEVETQIIEILNNLKIDKSVKTIMKALENPKFDKLFKTIAGTIWMSGLNYGEHTHFFVTKFIEEDFTSSFEAFTIIDNTDANHISNEIIDKSIKTLKENKDKIEEEKIQLYSELINVLLAKKDEVTGE